MKIIQTVFVVLFSGLLLACTTIADNASNSVNQVAIASATPEATQAGLEILEAGGNAFDAAIAVSAALGVTEPYSSGFGGGGLWLIQRASDGKQVMIDGREIAPLAAHRDMYLDANGEVKEDEVRWGALAAGIPGMPAGLVHLADNYGRLPLAQSLEPSIQLAREGFKATSVFVQHSNDFLEYMQRSAAMSDVFLKNDQSVSEGDLIVQTELADTISKLAEQGRDGFYKGEVSKALIDGTNAAGGIWTQQDFDNYKIVEREPIEFSYQDMKVVSSTLPSSGGVVMAEFFNILESYELTDMSDKERYHLIIEAMKRAYRDRAEYLGDMDFVEVPLAKLTSKEYAATLRQSIDLTRATPSKELPPAAVDTPKGAHTTHFSVIDAEGNRVAATLTINYPFGACFMPPGTGVILNNEMDDFSAKPGAPNLYGLVGGDANAIAPGKRMLSSMSPTIVETNERVGLLGTPGGSKIISMVMLATLAFLEGADAQQMVDLPRYHHQYLPDVVEVEPDAMSEGLQFVLQELGHEVKVSEPWGNMHVVLKNKLTGELDAASDKREVGQAEVRKIGVK